MSDNTHLFIQPAVGVKALKVHNKYFTVDDNEVINTLALCSPLYSGSVWWAREGNVSPEQTTSDYIEAVCRATQGRSWRAEQIAEHKDAHPVPNELCNCGLWAYHDLEGLSREPRVTDIINGNLDDPQYKTSHVGSVVAAIYAWGKGTLANGMTFRSKFMRAEALCSYSQVAYEDLEEIADGLGIPLLDRPDFDEYLATMDGIRLEEIAEWGDEMNFG